jgi:hypothetical protein
MDPFNKFRFRSVLGSFREYAWDVKRTPDGIRWRTYHDKKGSVVQKWLEDNLKGVCARIEIGGIVTNVELFDTSEITPDMIEEIARYIEVNY